jgi:isoleucyl-tRNA synthetase
MKALAGAIGQMDNQDISTLEQTGVFNLDLGEQMVTLTPEDVEISYDDIPGWTVASEEEVTIALDITLTDELRDEGIARDVVNRLQNLRKDMGLEVQDKIRIRLEPTNERIVAALKSNKDYICRETQATSLEFENAINEGVELDIDDEKLKVKIDV